MSGSAIVDIGILAMVLLSAVLALSRGFAKEALAMGALVAAAAATLYLRPYFLPYAQRYVSDELISNGATILVLFVVVLVLVSLVGHPIAVRVRQSRLGPVDRWLGFAFGALRGLAIVTIAYAILLWFTQPDQPPQWVTQARLVPYVQKLVPYVEEFGVWFMDLMPALSNDQTTTASITDNRESIRA